MTDADNDITAQLVELTRQPIELYKILKFEGLVGSGGEAKAAIAEGHVLVNEVVQTQKRKKILSGDVIQFDGNNYRMHCEQSAEPVDVVPSTESKVSTAKIDTADKIKAKSKKPVAKKAGRKAIGIKS
ncbi:MAG: RNA-binding S4 domain-containing protein [Gammaproteobacteria bacterium]|nr:RNA-binding S4 domain-containing protein [Gammaproteobacteria bacterium]MDG2337033.1 RNA-binding S4 domain-containing protein [Gammaproteobacteria bacterium]